MAELQLLVDLQAHSYKRWTLGQSERDKLIGLPKKSKKREIQQPKAALNAVHKRIALLLGRIEKPGFVYSATKRRSYVENAIQHQTDERCVKVDVKEFYPNIKFNRVRSFFIDQLGCSGDIAHVLAVLCCVNGGLPTGSAISPVLSYFACAPMFARIAKLSVDRELKFTLYVDDMVFSGDAANWAFSDMVRRVLKNNGFVGHKVTLYRAGDVKVVTGVAVKANFKDLPFARQRRIRMTEAAFAKSVDKEELRILGAALIGQYREAERIRVGMKQKALLVQARLNAQGIEPSLSTKPRKRLRLKMGAKIFDELRAQRARLLAARAKAARPMQKVSDPAVAA